MTDVTGFGLAGHLGSMLRASGASAFIDTTALPALPGAVELLSRGFRSTAHAENAKAKKGLVIHEDAAADARIELLFDPQTSGGLLFGLASSRVEEARGRLDRVTIIGEVRPPRADGALMEIGAHSTWNRVRSSARSSPLAGSRKRQPKA
jgi:selenide,water dikinase